MTALDKSVSNHEVIPLVDSNVFQGNPSASLSCGVLATAGIPAPGLEKEYAAHFELRRRVYVDQTGQLDPADIHADGTDRDEDDARSVTFAVYENYRSGVRIVGVSRLIIRGPESALPVEDFCPEVFTGKGLSPDSVEVSRVIARHENAAVQDLVQWQLFAVMLAYLANHKLGRTFAIIEPWLERHLNGAIAIQRIGEPRYVAHYRDYNLPVEIDLAASAQRVAMSQENIIHQYRLAEPGLIFFGQHPSRGRRSTSVDAQPEAGNRVTDAA